MIECHHISKHYLLGNVRLDVLRDISLNVKKGEFVALMGPSGSGKTTLMNLIGLLDEADEGDIVLNGTKITHKDRSSFPRLRRELIGFVFQTFNLVPRLSVQRNVLLPTVYARVPRGERSQRVDRILHDVGLKDRAHHTPSELSGGEHQRVAIARALINEPEIILADEPTGNLDSKTGNEIIDLLKTLNERGKTILLVTHDAEIAARADRTITLRDGRVV